MKKCLINCFCVLTVLILVSCDNPSSSAISNSDSSASSNTNEALLSRIIDLEKEIDSLKGKLQSESETEKQILNRHGAIFDALTGITGDNIYLGMDMKGDYMTTVYIKIPKGNIQFSKFFLITGYESNGTQVLNCLIKPQYDTGNDETYIEYGVDKDKYEIRKLMTSDIKYDENSSMIVIIIDNYGNEYSQYVPSLAFARDV